MTRADISKSELRDLSFDHLNLADLKPIKAQS